MADQHLRVPAINDRSLASFFRDVAEILKAKEFVVTEIGSPGQRSIPLDKFDDDYLRSSDLYTMYYAHVVANGFGVTLQRDVSSSASPEFDKLSVHNNQNQPQQLGQDGIRKVTRLISETFFPEPSQSNRLFLDPKTVSSLLASHQELLKRLESTATSVTEHVAAARIQLEHEFSERTRALEESFRTKQDEADQQARQLEQSISVREEELEERKRQLDDRDHIHARRQLREQITADISSRLQGAMIPPRTSLIGWGVFYCSIVGAVALGTLSTASFQEFSSIAIAAAKNSSSMGIDSGDYSAGLMQPTTTWFLLIRGFLAGFGAVAFLVYAISWLKSIYHDRVRSQRELERYSIDLNRASWAVETIMESKSSGGDIPDILVAGISQNLFGDASSAVEAGSEKEAVASLLRASVGAKIGPNGAEFQLNSRGANKLADKID